jgi:hypothetical protein
VSSLLLGSIVLGCVFGGALFGIFLRSKLPEHHLTAESKDAVKVGIGLIATMTALVLGLLVSTAKSSFDTKHNELTQMSADTLLLDRVLANYGPETKTVREQMHRAGARSIEMIWPQNGQALRLQPAAGGEVLYDMIAKLPRTAMSSAVFGLKRFRSRLGDPCPDNYAARSDTNRCTSGDELRRGGLNTRRERPSISVNPHTRPDVQLIRHTHQLSQRFGVHLEHHSSSVNFDRLFTGAKLRRHLFVE